jgi:L-ribulose-5-phosphate 3-epimerase
MIRPMEIGVFIHSTGIEDPYESIKTIGEWGFRCTQLGVAPVDFYTAENVARTRAAIAETGVEAVGWFVGFPGESYASMQDVAETVGFAFPEKLAERMEIMRMAIDFASQCRIPGVLVHMGFLPDDQQSPIYKQMYEAMEQCADLCKANKMYLGLETGQEQADHLAHFLQSLGRDNVYVNFDPANLILYGKDKPVDAFRRIGQHVISCHAKDGIWPTVDGQLGSEVPVGQGQVTFPDFVAALKELRFKGPIVIEREAGDTRKEDIFAARELLEKLIWG